MAYDWMILKDVIFQNVSIGTTDTERARPQVIHCCVAYKFSTKKSIKTQELQDTIDYVELNDALHSFVRRHTFILLEALADGLATMLLNKYSRIQNIKLKLYKPGALHMRASVAICLQRQQRNQVKHN
jgi:dihydroneopterin aldolase